MAMMIPTGPLPVNYPFYQQGQNSPPPNAYNPPQQQSRGNSLMDLFKQYNPVSWGVRQGERLGESGFGDALGNLMEPALSWYKQNTQKYMDEKGINAFGFPQSQDVMTPPPMIDDGQGMVPTPDQGATSEGVGQVGFSTYPPWFTTEDIVDNERRIREGNIQNEINGIRLGQSPLRDERWPPELLRQEGAGTPTGFGQDGIRVDLPTPTPDQGQGIPIDGAGPPVDISGDVMTQGSADFLSKAMREGNVSGRTVNRLFNQPPDVLQPFTPQHTPPLLNANIEGLPGLSRQYESGYPTTPGLIEGTSGGVQISPGSSREALANALPEPMGTQYAQLPWSDEPVNVKLQSEAWDRPGVNPRTVQDMHDEIGQAFPDFNQEEQMIATRIVNSSRHDTYDMTDRQKRKYIQDLHPTDKAILAEYGRWISGEQSPSQAVPNVPMPGPVPTTPPSGGSGMPAGGSGVMEGSFSPTNMPPFQGPGTI